MFLSTGLRCQREIEPQTHGRRGENRCRKKNSKNQLQGQITESDGEIGNKFDFNLTISTGFWALEVYLVFFLVIHTSCHSVTVDSKEA